MAVDPLMLTRFADQPHYRVLNDQSYGRGQQPVRPRRSSVAERRASAAARASCWPSRADRRLPPSQNPSLSYKATLALQYATRKGVPFEKFDESYSAGTMRDRDDLGTGFGVADAHGRHPGAARTRGIPP